MSRELPPPSSSWQRIQPRLQAPLDAAAVLSEAADWRRSMVLDQLHGGRFPTPSSKASAFLSGSKRSISSKQKDRARPMTSSERGIKFRKKQHERQQLLLSSTEKLRREIARLEALKDLREGSALVASFTEGGAPVKFAIEYFAQFRVGVPLPGGGEGDQMTIQQQESFLKNMIAPDMKFCGEDAIKAIFQQWRFKVVAHSSIRVERTNSRIVAVDNCATVVSEGVVHMRYARKTFELMYPHVVGNEALIQKLIGRMVHMPFRAKMFFNEDGKLEQLEIEPDLFVGLYDVLRDLKDCELLLGKTRMPKLIVNGPDQITILEPAAEKPGITAAFATSGAASAIETLEAESKSSEEGGRSQQTQQPACMPAVMNLKFILS